MSKEQSFWTLVARVGRNKYRINDAYAEDDMPILAQGVQDFRAELDKLKGGKKAKIVKEPVTSKFFWENFAKTRQDGIVSKVK